MKNFVFSKRNIEVAKKKIKPWASPIFTWLATQNSESYLTIKRQIESWVKNINPKKRKDIVNRLTSLNDESHLSSFFELMWHQFLFEENYEIKVEPKLNNGKRPEFFVKTKVQDLYFEVITAFEEDGGLKKKIKTTEEILGKIRSIKGCYCISIGLKEWFEPNFKQTHFVNFVKKTLDLLTASGEKFSEPKTILYEKDKYKVEVKIYPEKYEVSNILLAVHYPGYSGALGSKKIKGRMQEKISKYKDIKTLEKPLVIAFCYDSGSSIYLQPSVEYDLFGRPMVVFSVGDNSKESKWTRDRSGIFMQRNADGSSKNTRLSAVISCTRKWGKTDKYPEGSYVYEMEVFHNPFAKHPIDKEVFKKFPQYIPVIDKNGGHMEWINKPENENEKKVIVF